MNDRLGRFGRKELMAATALCTLIAGCFSVDDPSMYRNGNFRYDATLFSLLAAWMALEIAVRRIRKRGYDSLGTLLGAIPVWAGAPIALLLAASLLGAAMLPQVRYLRALTDFIFPNASSVALTVYLLPSMALLAWLGMETLARTGRILLPLTLAVTAIGLLSDAPYNRLYRLFPIVPRFGELAMQSVMSLFRFLPVVLLLLTVAPGAQGWKHVLSAGRIGLLLGGALTVLAELCLGMVHGYTELQELSSPLYRLLVEIDTDNAAIRLDRVVLFVWTMAGLFASACFVYGAGLLLAKSLHIGDTRPLCVLGAAVSVTAALLLIASENRGHAVLPVLHRFLWTLPTAPLVTVGLLGRKRRILP